MTIKGIGVDIEKILRFKKMEYNEHIGFYRKIFTKKEIKYCLSKKDCYRHFAARFCAKEAILKALSFNKKDYFLIEIQIINNKGGVPKVFLKKNINYDIKLSISHTDDIAVACAIVCTK